MIMRAKTSKPSSGRSEKLGAPKKKKSGFQYKPSDPKKMKERANQTGGTYDGIIKPGIDVWRSKEGDNVFRPLPATWDGHEHYGYDVWTHERVGVDKGSYPCLAKMFKKKCPICEAAAECAEAGEEEEAKALTAKRKVVAWIIDRDDDKLNPQIYIMSWTMDRDIVALAENKKTGKMLYIDHPDDGYDVSFKRKGTGLNTRYIGVAIDRDSSAIAESTKKQDAILEFIDENPIPSVIKFYDAKYLEQIISGTGDDKDEELDEQDDGDEDEEEEKTTSKKKKPASKRRDEPDEEEDEDEETPFDTDDDESEDEEDSDDEDEEEEKPKSKKKPVARKRRDDPEEDEEEDEEDPEDPDDDETEDDEEEEKPKSKTKVKPKVKPKSRRAPAEEEEDDDDAEETEEEEDSEDDEEEDDKEEEPKRRGSVKRRR